MIETQRQRLLASSFGDQRSRQVGHDHINYWNFSTGTSGEKKLGHQSLKESYTFSLYSCLCVLKFRRTNDDSDKNVHFNSNIQKVVLGRYFSQCFRALLMLTQVICQIRHDDTKLKFFCSPYSHNYFSCDEDLLYLVLKILLASWLMSSFIFIKCQDQNFLYIDWCFGMDCGHIWIWATANIVHYTYPLCGINQMTNRDVV